MVSTHMHTPGPWHVCSDAMSLDSNADAESWLVAVNVWLRFDPRFLFSAEGVPVRCRGGEETVGQIGQRVRQPAE